MNGIQGKCSQHLRGHDDGGYAGQVPGIWLFHLPLMFLWNHLGILSNSVISISWLVNRYLYLGQNDPTKSGIVPRFKILWLAWKGFLEMLFSTPAIGLMLRQITPTTKRICALSWQNPNRPNTFPTLYQEAPRNIICSWSVT